jgi:hypothetical protein
MSTTALGRQPQRMTKNKAEFPQRKKAKVPKK